MLGYLFYVGDRRRTNLPYRNGHDAKDTWFRLRDHRLYAGCGCEAAEAAQDRYGFQDFELKGGVLAGDEEMTAAGALCSGFPMPA